MRAVLLLTCRDRPGLVAAVGDLVVSNHETLEAMTHRFGVPFRHLPVADDGRAEQEQTLAALLDGDAPDLVVLARYMRILPGWLVARYRERIINIHHSFLPAFAGA